jgi:hypothetical protein
MASRLTHAKNNRKRLVSRNNRSNESNSYSHSSNGAG